MLESIMAKHNSRDYDLHSSHAEIEATYFYFYHSDILKLTS